MRVDSILSGVGGLALISLAVLILRSGALATLSNSVLKGWHSNRRIDPLSRYNRYRSIALALMLCFFGVLLLLAAVGLG